MKKRLSNLDQILIDEKGNKKVLCICTYTALFLVATVMTILNIETQKGALTLSTAFFAGACLLDLILTLIGPVTEKVARFLFGVEALILFTFFLVTGNPEGFSAIWICLLPTLGMLFFGKNPGSVLCLVQFIILVFLLWTKQGQALLQYDYTNSFMMRFPILFVSFHLVAYFMETLRILTYRELVRMENKYKSLSQRDSLTGLFNRQGMYAELESMGKFKEPKSVGAIIFDIDFFKSVNDTYGHNVGDAVLIQFASILKQELDAVVCRWGGEEFVAIYTENHVTRETLDHLLELVGKTVFEAEGQSIHITVSGGVAEQLLPSFADVDRMIEEADDCLYQAKKSGRNQVIYQMDAELLEST